MKDLHERTGAAIQKAAKDLPEGYEITIELERGAGNVRLYIHSVEVIADFSGYDIAGEIENAIAYAIEHKINAES